MEYLSTRYLHPSIFLGVGAVARNHCRGILPLPIILEYIDDFIAILNRMNTEKVA